MKNVLNTYNLGLLRVIFIFKMGFITLYIILLMLYFQKNNGKLII